DGQKWLDLQLGGFGDDLDADQRREQLLVVRRLFGGWNQARGGLVHIPHRQPRVDLHLTRFGRDLDADQRAGQLLVVRRLFGGWNQVGRGGWRRFHTRSDLQLDGFGYDLDADQR